MLRIFVAVMMVMVTTSVVCADLKSYSELEDLIQKNSVKDLDRLIPLLPADMQKNFVLIYESHALRANLVTPDTPRIVFFNRDGSLVFAITQNPGAAAIAAGQDGLEVISFDRSSAQFEMRELIFDGKSVPGGTVGVSRNRAVCLACHGQEPRPIFQDYNSWPGFYGSFSQDGLSKAGSREYVSLQKFLGGAKSSPRYQDLKLDNFKKVPLGMIYEESEALETPAAQLGRRFEELMFRRAAAKLVGLQQYTFVKPLLEFLGSNSSTCGTRAERTKLLYREWTKDPATKVDEMALMSKIDRQIRTDYAAKVRAFESFNEVETSYYDKRGVFSIPYFLAILGRDPYYPVDQVYFRNQLMIMEAVLRYVGLQSHDVSTSPTAPTIGIFHTRSVSNGEENQNYFWGLADALALKDSKFRTDVTSCAADLNAALEVLKTVGVPDSAAKGILYE